MPFRTVSLAALFLFAGTAAQAETVERRLTPAGGEVQSYGQLEAATCKVGPPPAVRVTREPLNGKVRVAEREVESPGLGPNDPRCKGTKVRRAGVSYQPNAGFKGVDAFAYEVNFGPGRTRTIDARVTVQ